MEKAGIEEELINAVKKIYSFSRFRIDPLINDIYVNKGVLQGSILSPILFNFVNIGILSLIKFLFKFKYLYLKLSLFLLF